MTAALKMETILVEQRHALSSWFLSGILFKSIIIIHCTICIIADNVIISSSFNNDQLFYISIPVWKLLIDNVTHGASASLCWISVLILQSEKQRDRNGVSYSAMLIAAHTENKSRDREENDGIIKKMLTMPSKLCNLKKMKRFWNHHGREMMLAFATGSILDLDHFLAAKSYSLFDATHLDIRPFGHNLLFLTVSTSIIFIFISRRFSLLFFTAVFNHLSRDSVRRGYSLFPFISISTHKVPYILYLCTLFVLPLYINYHSSKFQLFWAPNSANASDLPR